MVIISISKLYKTLQRMERHEPASPRQALPQGDHHSRTVPDVPGRPRRHGVVRVQHMEGRQEVPDLRQLQHGRGQTPHHAVLLLQVPFPFQRQEGYGHGALPHILPELGDSHLPVCRQPQRGRQHAAAPGSWDRPEGRMVHGSPPEGGMEAACGRGRDGGAG